jgi:hypothetical protein
MVAGDPAAAVNGQANAGRINVLYGNGKATLLVQGAFGVPDSAEAGDRFGSVLQTIDLDSDRYSDLVVGVPGEGVGAADDAGTGGVLLGLPVISTPAFAVVPGQDGVPDGAARFGVAVD